ncbi:cyclic nucleotide-binding-like protein [Fimicolochytrium jonesii]|uniref:cyclic nucleotide-binding-like protein n=1 Tax=Fimicolochytrium jonesii TaxID=1396493 RepID=UPI0022FE7C65|nr:cyclic nucleotide-binding-like protein [Fimicolochytrium jonesii]KAI8817229.1 cyclic nucleotide-binding-like protein [Fimicolochytrium jonesii]
MGERFNSDQFTVPAEFPEILKDLNKEILRAQPQDIYQFCSNYFQKKLEEQRTSEVRSRTSESSVIPSVSDDERGQDEEDHEETGHDTDDHDDEEDDDVDDIAPPPPPTNYNRGRRTSVSAESMAPTLDKDFVKVVIPKSDDQKQRIEAAIRGNFLFKSLDDDQYHDVVNAMAEKRVSAGDEVIKQGGIGDFFYVVETGALDVFVSRNGQPAVKVFDYGANGSFGELALMYNAPRAATVVATQECVLWALDRVTFRRILMENTSRKRRMYEAFLEEVPLLVSLEPYERHKIADALESVSFNDGDVVIKQGDVGDAFFIIESGDARVITTDENGIEHEMPGLQKGDYFGELALLSDKPRRATVIARGRLKCATLGKKPFVRLLGPVVDIIKRNASNYLTYSERISLD